jgi:DNA-binding response OmpR family regulator
MNFGVLQFRILVQAVRQMSRPRILLIDDDPFIRSLVTAMLRGEFFVSVATDGMQGNNLAVENPPDLVIVDVEMPGWDGLETINKMRAKEALQRIPVMVLTGDASRETVMNAIQMGTNDYLIKTSLTPEELVKKTHRLIKLDAVPLNPHLTATVG